MRNFMTIFNMSNLGAAVKFGTPKENCNDIEEIRSVYLYSKKSIDPIPFRSEITRMWDELEEKFVYTPPADLAF